ncbi:SAVMC3_10250 family protein [Streptomyces sp. NPDC006332]|uniref:DUF7019 family protein n=1 Tax=Streptomyces sp. NPDC006332 TaxID=3155456 RepID=UPI0033B237D5
MYRLIRGSPLSFRYYLYVSDSKVDMLLHQIDPAFTRKRTSEVSVGLKVVGAKRGTEVSEGTDRIARLERVVRHLDEVGDVGTVDEPRQFFRGLMDMKWGPFTTGAGSSLVYFGGSTERTVVGLGGSSRHVLGSLSAPDGDNAVLARSLMPSLLDGLAAHPEIEELFEDAGHAPVDADLVPLRAVQRATTLLRGPSQKVEFLAKRLLHGPVPAPRSGSHDGMTVLLGSPLYVAHVD